MDEKLDSRAEGVARTVVAVNVLLIFWGAIGYSFWPELMPRLLGSVQLARSIGAEEYESQYFVVQNNSDASATQIRGVINVLEADYLAILEFLDRPRGNPIPVLITNGSGMAIAGGYRLNIFYDNGVLDLNSAPFFLVFLIEGGDFGAEINFFLEAGFAIYVTEEIGRSQNFTGQTVDAWVKLLQQQDALLPLSVAWETRIPENDEEAYDFIRSMVMSGSFIRWLVETYGMDALHELHDGLNLEYVIDMSFNEAEAAWLASLTDKEIKPRTCRLAAPPNSFLQYLCEQLDEKVP